MNLKLFHLDEALRLDKIKTEKHHWSPITSLIRVLQDRGVCKCGGEE